MKDRLFVSLVEYGVVAFMAIADLEPVYVEDQAASLFALVRSPEFDGEVVLQFWIDLERKAYPSAVLGNRIQWEKLTSRGKH